jgi:hypothetical protein
MENRLREQPVFYMKNAGQQAGPPSELLADKFLSLRHVPGQRGTPRQPGSET